MADLRQRDARDGIERTDAERRVLVAPDADLSPELLPLYQIYHRSPRNMNGRREPAQTLALMDEAARRITVLRDPEFREYLLGVFDDLDIVTAEVEEQRRNERQAHRGS